MSDLRNYSREFITEFISIYREHPCLWKIKSVEYSNRNKKQAAYEVLCNKLKEKDPIATKDSVIKKINSLRSCFRKEMKKVKASEKSGAGAGDIYKPSLWYFDQLFFLLDQETPREGTSNIETDDTQEQATAVRSEDEDYDLNTPLLSPETPSSIQSHASASQNKVIKRKGRNTQSDEILGLVANKLKSPPNQQYQAYGQHVAEELRAMVPEQALFCQKVINDAIFEAKLKNLNRTSRILTSQNSLQPINISTSADQITSIQNSQLDYNSNTYGNNVVLHSESQTLPSRYDNAGKYFHTFNG